MGDTDVKEVCVGYGKRKIKNFSITNAYNNKTGDVYTKTNSITSY